MEKIRTFKASSDGCHHVDAYRASDVDALLADVRRLVEALNKWVNPKYCYDLQKAIAAVERHLETTNHPHSSPPPADTGKA